MDALGLIVLGLTVTLGAAVQRVTGMGLALVASPILVMLIGPGAGVAVLQVLGVIASAIVLLRVWRWIDWKTLPWLVVAAAVGIVPGALLARALPGPWLEVSVGVLVLVALAATVLAPRARIFKGRGGALAAGMVSGFMNAVASLGGPALVLYRMSTDWSQRVFVATVQLYFIFLSGFTLVARGVPRMPSQIWLVSLGTMVVGIWAGDRLAGRVSEVLAIRTVLLLALAGGLVAVVRGIMAL